MDTLASLSSLARKLAERFELDEQTAGRYANLIGDTPEFDEEQRIIVREWNGEIIALLPTRQG